MASYFKDGVVITQSGTSDVNVIREIIHGAVTIELPSVAANGAISSASAAVNGITSQFRVLVMPSAWIASNQVIIAAAAGITDGIQVTATNPNTAAIDATAQSFNYFAWR